MRDLVEELDALRGGAVRIAMATLVGARGGSPRPLGAKMFVGEDGRLHGSVSIGGCVDARLGEHARRLLGANRRERVTVKVDDDEALELGLSCGAEFDLIVDPVALDGPDPVLDTYREAIGIARGGQTAFVYRPMDGRTPPSMVTDPREPFVQRLVDTVRTGAYAGPAGEWFVERIAPPDVLVIVGASDVALALARIARLLGMRIVVADGRERSVARERFAPDEVLVGMPSELVRPWLRDGTYLVLAAHDYKYELPILREALRAPLRYVGMLSGRKRAASVRALLAGDGLTGAQLARLHAPIGLDIGGREPEDIALSIAAQIVAVREGKPIARRAGAEAEAGAGVG